MKAFQTISIRSCLTLWNTVCGRPGVFHSRAAQKVAYIPSFTFAKTAFKRVVLIREQVSAQIFATRWSREVRGRPPSAQEVTRRLFRADSPSRACGISEFRPAMLSLLGHLSRRRETQLAGQRRLSSAGQHTHRGEAARATRAHWKHKGLQECSRDLCRTDKAFCSPRMAMVLLDSERALVQPLQFPESVCTGLEDQ